MKKKALNTALLAGLAGVAGIANIASAVNLNPDGIGEVLLYPYYTVNGGNQTLLSVVNTTGEVKAVKVRFMESENTAEVLDFNLYMSPFDVWVGAISGGDTGPGILSTPDTSCTVPTIPAAGVAFRNFQYAGDGGGDELERTREGHVEIIEMGEVVGPLGANAIHTTAGTPDDCPALVAAWAPSVGVWTLDPETDMASPNGGLFGGASIINVPGAYMGSYNADAISAFYDPTDGSSLHTNPGSLSPSLDDALTGAPGDPVEAILFDNGALVTATFANGIDAVSAVLMRDSIMNEYAIDSSVSAATEWVITFPTKRFYVNPGINEPFTSDWDAPANPGQAPEPVAIGIWDREEQVPGLGDVDFSPQPPGVTGPQLPYETNVVTFGQGDVPSAILGSPNAQNIDPTAVSAATENGWARLSFVDAGHFLTSEEGITFLGLPVTGFSYTVVRNGDVGGVAANYAGIFSHRSSRATSQ